MHPPNHLDEIAAAAGLAARIENPRLRFSPRKLIVLLAPVAIGPAQAGCRPFVLVAVRHA